MNFNEDVYKVVRRVPKGHVVTYGQIAMALGKPGASRAVGNALHANPDGDATPCFRVVNAKGELTKAFVFGGVDEHKRRLEEDGIEVVDYKVDLKKYGYNL